MVLVSVALLLARSLARVHSIDPGFDLGHTAWARVNVLSDRYAKDQVYLFASRLLRRRAASLASGPPRFRKPCRLTISCASVGRFKPGQAR